jgi:hypothetical protein
MQQQIATLALVNLAMIWMLLIPIQSLTSISNTTLSHFLSIILFLIAFFVIASAFFLKLQVIFVKNNFFTDLLLAILITNIFTQFLFSQSRLVLNGNSIQDQLGLNNYLQDFIIYNVFLFALLAFRKWNTNSIKKKLILGTMTWTVGLILITFSFYLLETVKNNLNVSTSQKYVKYQFGNDADTLFVVLDSFQGSYLDEIIEKYPYETTFLSGFKYLPDTLAAYPTTRGSATNFSTGVLNLNSQKTQSHIKTQNHIVDYFKDNGYSLDLSVSPISGLEYNFDENDIQQSVSTLLPRTFTSTFITSINQLEVAFFKLAPNIMKPYLYNGGNWVFSTRLGSFSDVILDEDKKFLDEFSLKVSPAEDGEKIFHFYHLRGAHFPLRSTSAYPEFGLEPSDDPVLDNSRIALQKLRVIIENLKRTQRYNSLEIVVISDHGYGAVTVKSSPTDANYDIAVAQAAADAVLLFKPRNSLGDLEISYDPMSLSDVPCLLTTGNFLPGCRLNVSNIWKTANEDSGRRFFNYDWRHENWQDKFLPPLQEFYVNGDSNVIANWSKVELANISVKSWDIDDVPINLSLEIGDSGVSKYLILRGFSDPEGTHRWSLGSFSSIEFKVNPKITEHGLKVELKVAPLRDTELGKRLVIFVNGKYLKMVALENSTSAIILDIPKNFLNGANIKIAFETPGSISPKILNMSQDPRLLGRLFKTIKVIENKK